MKRFFLFVLIGLPLLTACAAVQADYYGSMSPARPEIYRSVESGHYHKHVTSYRRGVTLTRPGRQVHRHAEAVAGNAVIVTPGNRPHKVHGHSAVVVPHTVVTPIIRHPSEQRNIAKNSTHGHR